MFHLSKMKHILTGSTNFLTITPFLPKGETPTFDTSNDEGFWSDTSCS